MKTLGALLVCVIGPIAFVLWVYWRSKRFPAPDIPPEDRNDLRKILKHHRAAYGPKVNSVAIVVLVLWLIAVLARFF